MDRSEEVPGIVKDQFEKLPHFSDGRIDYTDADRAATVVVFLKHEDEILLLKRSDEVGTHKGRWGLVAGYLDELKPVVDKALEEVQEETGIEKDIVSEIKKIGSYKFHDDGITYTSFIVFMKLEEKPEIEISWEHTDWNWVELDDVGDFLSEHALAELRMALSE